ncbi:MAG TPA: FAD-dependent monooxygenase [Pyrinomonadaceae bacterium]|jgi:geranylgeranyl reductase family protein|nr:FAD-dependent monooxygenase [Pyrinomonadaceae bacterium]
MNSQPDRRAWAENRPRVAVVGAGPAGCAAAITLKGSGAEVTLFERGRANKDKPCGDAFLPSAVELLEALGVDGAAPEALGARPFHQVEVQTETLGPKRGTLKPGPGWLIPRASLDQRLRDIAARDADISYGSSVGGIAPRREGGIDLEVGGHGATKVLQFDAVIIAAGSASPLAKEQGLDGRPVTAAAITQYVTMSGLEVPLFLFLKQFLPGYAWTFPLGEGRYNIGVGVLSPEKVKCLRRLMESFTEGCEISEASHFRGGSMQLWSGDGSAWHHPAGMVSCGDSAGLIDPYNGEGLTAAMLSGVRAGNAVASYLKARRDAAHLESYSLWVREHFNREYYATKKAMVCKMLCGLG